MSAYNLKAKLLVEMVYSLPQVKICTMPKCITESLPSLPAHVFPPLSNNLLDSYAISLFIFLS